MNLQHLLLRKKEAILQGWLCGIFDSYSPETGSFLLDRGDRFANPVGYAISSSAGQLLDALIRGDDPVTLHGHLETIIKIRAVQDFTSSEAVGFMHDLKAVIRSQVMGGATKYGLLDELNELEIKIDYLGYTSAELYTKIKTQIRELALNEAIKACDFKTRVISIRKV
jgi:hypothetical protein